MKKVVYIHGLGGSGNGTSAQNVKKALGEGFEFSANTYDLLKPEQAFERIQADVKAADYVVASSLGAFYAASVICDRTMLLLNPCLEPENAIKKILYPEQQKDFDEQKCVREWLEIKSNWKELDREEMGERFAVFSDKDELFSYIETFKKNLGTFFGTDNFATIHGTHEIAKDQNALAAALDLFWKYIDASCDIMAAGAGGSLWWFDPSKD